MADVETGKIDKNANSKVSDLGVMLGVTSDYARAPLCPRHIVHISPPGGGPYFSDAFLRPRLVLG